MDLTKLSMGDKVIAISGILLFIPISFLDWFQASAKGIPGGASSGGNAWDFTLTWLAVLLGIAMVVLVALKLFEVKVPDIGGASWGTILLGMGVAAFAFVIIKTIAGVGVPDGAEDIIDISRKIGLFAGVVASAGLAAGGYLRLQEEKAGGGSAAPPTA